MRRFPLFVVALLTIACNNDLIAPKQAPRLDPRRGRQQLTGVTWEKSTTGVDIVPIGLYNGQYTILIDINDNNLAVGWGYADTPDGPMERAISWKDGVFTDLGTLGGNFSRARQSNNAGVIVGESQDAAGSYAPAVWENGVIRELPRLLPGVAFTFGNAQSINERGDIVGNDYGYNGTHAVLWPVTGGIVDLGLLPGTDLSWATGINRDGIVMGQSLIYSNFTYTGRATIWRNGAISQVALPPDGRPIGADITTGQMFNDAGDFLADLPGADPNYFGRAIVFRGRAFETLAMLPNAQFELSEPLGLNEAGDVVGEAFGPFNLEPVLWSHDGTLTNLGQPSGMLAGDAHGINNRGLIVGQASGEWTPGGFNSGAVLWRISIPDVTPPTIGYSSHPAAYAVDQHVSITCTATDAESGIASNTCAPIDGDAYVFGLGPHTFSATATDNAGNSASASTSFTVSVTFGSLTNLTRRFVTNSKVADALAGDLSDAEKASGKGKAKQLEAALNDYRHGVKAQVGKSITAERGSILIGLSQGL
jgi:probable HAF family extracellular repeat protein